MLTSTVAALLTIAAPSPVAGEHLVFASSPTNISAGGLLPPIIVQVVDGSGLPITSSANIQIDVAGGTPGAKLFGTTVKALVNGTAVFSDLSVQTAGAGYVLSARSRTAGIAVSSAFDVAPGAAAQLGFAGIPSGASFEPLTGVEVRVEDAFHNVVPSASANVTLSLGSNPGVTLLHSAGTFNHVLEYIDPVSPALLPPLADQSAANIAALTYDPASGLVYASDILNHLSVIDPGTGAQSFVGTPGALAITTKGLAFTLYGGNRLLSVATTSTDLFMTNPLTAALISMGQIALAGDTVLTFNGLATDPTSGFVYAVAQTSVFGPVNRVLIQIDPATAAATLVGPMGDKVAGLAVSSSGEMYACTGQGSTAIKKLYRVDKHTGAMIEILSMGGGDVSEAITFVPARLAGTLTAPTSGGVASFTDLKLNAPGNSYTLKATAPGFGAAESLYFTVSPPNQSGVVSMASAGATASESAGTVSVVLTLSPAQAHETVAWVKVLGSATGAGQTGEDHTLATFIDIPVVIPKGQTSVQLPITILEDAVTEPSETVVITIQRVALGAKGTADTFTLTIQDND